ncbi:MAG: hypothetical protein ACYDA1_04875 [Vulcanimicrobiaceae bacterium]
MTMPKIPNATIRERVRFGPIFDCQKHNLASDSDEYATDKIDAMSNSELLSEISNAMEELFADIHATPA